MPSGSTAAEIIKDALHGITMQGDRDFFHTERRVGQMFGGSDSHLLGSAPDCWCLIRKITSASVSEPVAAA